LADVSVGDARCRRDHAPRARAGPTARLVGGHRAERELVRDRPRSRRRLPADACAPAGSRARTRSTCRLLVAHCALVRWSLRAASLVRARGRLVTVDLASRAPLLAAGADAGLRAVRACAPDILFANHDEMSALVGSRGARKLLDVAPIVASSWARRAAVCCGADQRGRSAGDRGRNEADPRLRTRRRRRRVRCRLPVQPARRRLDRHKPSAAQLRKAHSADIRRGRALSGPRPELACERAAIVAPRCTKQLRRTTGRGSRVDADHRTLRPSDGVEPHAGPRQRSLPARGAGDCRRSRGQAGVGLTDDELEHDRDRARSPARRRARRLPWHSRGRLAGPPCRRR